MCDIDGGFREFDIQTRIQVKSFPIKSVKYCVVTHDNKSLITCDEHQEDYDIDRTIIANLTIWSIRSKKKLHTWESDVDEYVSS